MEQVNCQELFTLTIEQFARTIEMGIPLEALFVLECMYQGTNPAAHVKEPKMEAINQLLTRKSFLSEGRITPLGQKVYESLRCGGMAKDAIQELKKELSSSFDIWWNIFPLHDGFTTGTRKFDKTRALRTSKSDCQNLFNKAVAQGPYTAEQIIAATKAHISSVKAQSAKTRTNKLSFVHNSATYLRQQDYVAWIGDSEVKLDESSIKDQVSSTTFEL
jgi:hypothetical protein